MQPPLYCPITHHRSPPKKPHFSSAKTLFIPLAFFNIYINQIVRKPPTGHLHPFSKLPIKPHRSMKFPAPWLHLLRHHSSLGDTAAATIAEVEAAVHAREQAGETVFPERKHRYLALEHVSPDEFSCLLLGQDPYIRTVRQASNAEEIPEATGLSFSVPADAKLPPSLRNIFKELSADLGQPFPSNGDLAPWTRSGVLLLNSVLTVRQGLSNSHATLGWQTITGALIEAISHYHRGRVFILWGRSAQSLASRIAPDRGHCLIESPHPSPLGGSCNRGFFGSRPFSRANQALEAAGLKQIDWSLPFAEAPSPSQAKLF